MCFKLSTTQSGLLSNWKKTVVAHIFKTVTKHKPKIYRPEGLTGLFIKLLEKIVRNELFEYLDKTWLPQKSNMALKNRYSTFHKLISSLEASVFLMT